MMRHFATPYDCARLVHVMLPETTVVIELHRVDGSRQYIWTRGQLRKPKSCCRCWRDMVKKESAFRPITNREERPDRLCLQCVADIVAGRDWDEVKNARVNGRSRFEELP